MDGINCISLQFFRSVMDATEMRESEKKHAFLLFSSHIMAMAMATATATIVSVNVLCECVSW